MSAALSLAFALASAASEPPPEPRMAEIDRMVDAAGLRLHLHCEGEGSSKSGTPITWGARRVTLRAGES